MISNVVDYLKMHTKIRPKVGIILGSGLQKLSLLLDNKKIVKYSDIPSFIDTSVDGHAGEFIIGEVNGLDVICANGRFHYYEGLSYDKVHIIIDIFNKMECEYIITYAQGGGPHTTGGNRMFTVWARSTKPAGTELEGHTVQRVTLDVRVCPR